MEGGKCSTGGKIACLLLAIGGLNWGLVGVGMLMNKGAAYNLVTMLVGRWPMVEAIVYVLVGLAALCSFAKMAGMCKK